MTFGECLARTLESGFGWRVVVATVRWSLSGRGDPWYGIPGIVRFHVCYGGRGRRTPLEPWLLIILVLTALVVGLGCVLVLLVAVGLVWWVSRRRKQDVVERDDDPTESVPRDPRRTPTPIERAPPAIASPPPTPTPVVRAQTPGSYMAEADLFDEGGASTDLFQRGAEVPTREGGARDDEDEVVATEVFSQYGPPGDAYAYDKDPDKR